MEIKKQPAPLKETSLAQLRSTIATTQRKVLDGVLDRLLADSKPIPVRILQGDMGRSTVTEALNQLGGSVLFEIHHEGQNCYQLTQLGVLLSSRGEEAESLLQKYIRHLRKEFKANVSLDRLSSKEIQLALTLDSDEMQLLFVTLTSSGHGRLGSRYGGNAPDGTWYMSVDDDVTELSERDQPALREWIDRQVLIRYNPRAPVTELGRSAEMLSAQRSFFPSIAPASESTLDAIREVSVTDKVFVVHGHSEGPKAEIEVFLRELGLEPIVLHRKSDQGLTLIEKFEKHSDVKYAVIILTPDDIVVGSGPSEHKIQKEEGRARQNVIFEWGFFVGKLGRGKVCCLNQAGTVLPSDVHGIVYKPFENSIDEIKYSLRKELVDAGLDVRG